jgi:hypothetical protein
VRIGGNVLPPASGAPSVTDTTAKNNIWYVYFVLAQFTVVNAVTEPVRSGIAMSQPFRK